jgi:hypothetical protein
VAQHVGERLLHDPVARRVHRRGQRAEVGDVQADLDPRGAQRAGELVEVAEPAGGPERRRRRVPAQHAERGAQVAQRLPARRLDLAQRRARLLGVVVDEVGRDAGLHVDGHHRVGDDIVDLA